MARQFRNDDTSFWTDKYGAGGDGAYAPGSGTDATANTSATGTGGTNTLNVGAFAGFANLNLVLIHQTQGNGVGNWELNKINSGGATNSWTMAYPLQNTYQTGAQVYLLKQYSSANIALGVTINAPTWNGTTGGIFALLVNGTATIAGTVNANGIGFRGSAGEGNGAYVGRRGEGTTGNDTGRNTSNQGNGGGAGGYSTNGPWDQGNGAGGGAAYTNGESGHGTGGGGNQGGGPGAAGVPIVATDATVFTLGGAGGEGGNNNSSGGSGAGGFGAACVIIIATTISVTGAINCNGSNGGQVGFHSGCGGSGAGGVVLLKGQSVAIGSNLVSCQGGAHITNLNGGPDADGGAGGNGIVHIDWSTVVTGSSVSPTSTRQDTALGSVSQRQFRSDDSTLWRERYGFGANGAWTPGSGTLSPIDSAASGTINTFSLSATNGSFVANQIIMIHQTKFGAAAGAWELNVISSYVSGTITTKYPLAFTYSGGAQVMVIPQYTSVNIANGVTVTVKPWNGTTGGLFAFLCLGIATISGTIDLSGLVSQTTYSQFQGNGGGFMGGGGSIDGGPNSSQAYSGESERSDPYRQDPASDNSNGSAGGGGRGGGGSGWNGTSYHTDTSLVTLFTFGGSGGGMNANSGHPAAQAGANGGAIGLVIAKILNITNTAFLTANGGQGLASGGNNQGPSGSGEAGCWLFKSQNITLGSSLITAKGQTATTSTASGDPGGNGGARAIGGNRGSNPGTGGDGIIHIDYLVTPTGSTNPGATTRFDAILADGGNFFIV